MQVETVTHADRRLWISLCHKVRPLSIWSFLLLQEVVFQAWLDGFLCLQLSTRQHLKAEWEIVKLASRFRSDHLKMPEILHAASRGSRHNSKELSYSGPPMNHLRLHKKCIQRVAVLRGFLDPRPVAMSFLLLSTISVLLQDLWSPVCEASWYGHGDLHPRGARIFKHLGTTVPVVSQEVCTRYIGCNHQVDFWVQESVEDRAFKRLSSS